MGSLIRPLLLSLVLIQQHPGADQVPSHKPEEMLDLLSRFLAGDLSSLIQAPESLVLSQYLPAAERDVLFAQ